MTASVKLATVICLAAGLSGCQPPDRTAREGTTRAEEPDPSAEVQPSSPASAPQEAAPEPSRLLDHLDPNRNGLYDDKERAVLLAALQEQSPALEGITFDADGDGTVTVLEQTAGRHPLSMVIQPEHIVPQEYQIPWGIDIFSEWIMSGYLQEDVADGPVALHTPRGTAKVEATAAADAQPQKAMAGAGVEFAANSGQHLTMPGHRDARWNYRWCLFTFRIDGDSGSDDETLLLELNRGKGPNKSSPKIWYHKNDGLGIQYVGRNVDGLDRRIMTSKEVIADGKTWNVLVCGIRYGQMFASLNGRELATEAPQPPRFSGERAEEKTSTYLGGPGKGNAEWAYDALVFGLTEPTENMVRKMTGWAAHRLGFQESLPEDHPYQAMRPVLDAEDFPARYVHDDQAWTEWGLSLKNKAETRVNAGGPRVEPQGFERVFIDDFRSNRVTPSTSGEGDLWMGPGFNTAVGVDAPLVTPGQKPDVYFHYEKSQKQVVSLAQQANKRWRGSAIYTVNDMGHGYTWAGPKVFRIRCMFPEVPQKELAGGLFPAFWSYSPEWLFWRTANRIEVDHFEFDGQNGRWLNGLASHVHYVHVKNIFAQNPERYKSYKVYGGELNEAKGKIPGGLHVWDGKFHTWEYVFDEDQTYVNVTIIDENGEERWVEICRSRTPEAYLVALDLQINYALKGNHGAPKDGDVQNFVVDWVEVLQKSAQLEEVPSPFTARPALSGSNAAGSTITCDPMLEGVSDVRYFWFADDYPLTWGPSSSYTLTSADAGKAIRCMVKAVGAVNSPEAWSDTVR